MDAVCLHYLIEVALLGALAWLVGKYVLLQQENAELWRVITSYKRVHLELLGRAKGR